MANLHTYTDEEIYSLPLFLYSVVNDIPKHYANHECYPIHVT